MTKEEREERVLQEASVLDFLQARAGEEQLRLVGKKSRLISTAMTRERLFHQEFEAIAERIFKNKLIIPAPRPLKKQAKTKERIVNLVLSDLHFGAALDPREVPLGFGAVEEARRLASVVQQAVDYKPQYRHETQLYVHLIGDIIQGKLHDPQAAQAMSRQKAAALHLLLQALGYLSQAYPLGMTVFCTPGNHGRYKDRHKERATDEKWDSHETDIYYGLKKAFEFAGTKHVKFVIPLTPFYIWDAFNLRGFGTHGDTVLSVGFPGKSIDVEKARRQVNEINAGLGEDQSCSLFISGHVHTASQVALPNRVVLLTNGALIPADAYAVSIGILTTACSQYMFESVEDHICGDSRRFDVDEFTDKDKSLDAIVKPFTDF